MASSQVLLKVCLVSCKSVIDCGLPPHSISQHRPRQVHRDLILIGRVTFSCKTLQLVYKLGTTNFKKNVYKSVCEKRESTEAATVTVLTTETEQADEKDQKRRLTLFDGRSSACYNSTGLDFLYKHWIKGTEWSGTIGEQL